MFKSVYQVTAVHVHSGPGSCHHGTHLSMTSQVQYSSLADKLCVYETSGTQWFYLPHIGHDFGVNPAYNGVLYHVRLLQ